mmetsp:Transcript_5497/g.16726  ORF Transcript_5497/g.16726 Transcript_5497/m.16726 type:complete len:97 (-) Transcript_5497:1444-1734(-)
MAACAARRHTGQGKHQVHTRAYIELCGPLQTVAWRSGRTGATAKLLPNVWPQLHPPAALAGTSRQTALFLASCLAKLSQNLSASFEKARSSKCASV